MRPRQRIPDETLRRLQDELPIRHIIECELAVPSKEIEGVFRFLCPRCSGFNTTTNPRTELARCFRCQKNYNPIDIVMAVERCSFTDAVRLLESRGEAEAPSE